MSNEDEDDTDYESSDDESSEDEDDFYHGKYTTEGKLLRFTKLCESIRRNDPNRTKIKASWYFPRSFGQALGEALLENTVVQKMYLDIVPLGWTPNPNVDALVRFVRTSATLRRVRMGNLCALALDETSNYAHVSGPILDAMAENPHQTMTTLELVEFPTYPIQSLVRLVRMTVLTSLKLDLRQHGFESIDELFVSLGASTSLERVDLTFPSTEFRVMALGLEHFRLNEHSKLRYLRFALPSGRLSTTWALEFFQELGLLLGHSQSLRHLVLNGFDFGGKNRMKRLADGILTSRSLYRLCFHHCIFNDSARATFGTLMQTRRPDWCVLEELDMGSRFLDPSCIITIPDSVIAGLEIVRGGPTIGSALTLLHLDRVETGAFFSALARNASPIVLRYLVIDVLDEGTSHLACIPQLVHLITLWVNTVITGERNETYLPKLVRAIKQNGSLRSVNIGCTKRHQRSRNICFFAESQETVPCFRGICARNTCIRILQVEPHLWSLDNTHTKSAYQVVPLGFSVVQEAPRQAPANMLSFLNAVGDVVGPDSAPLSGKRTGDRDELKPR